MKKIKSLLVAESLASCFIFSSYTCAVDKTMKPSLTVKNASTIYYNNESQYELKGTTEPNGKIEVEMIDEKQNKISYVSENTCRWTVGDRIVGIQELSYPSFSFQKKRVTYEQIQPKSIRAMGHGE